MHITIWLDAVVGHPVDHELRRQACTDDCADARKLHSGLLVQPALSDQGQPQDDAGRVTTMIVSSAAYLVDMLASSPANPAFTKVTDVMADGSASNRIASG